MVFLTALCAVAWLLLAGTLAVLFSMVTPANRRVKRLAAAFPSPPALPVLGHALAFVFADNVKIFKVIEEWYWKYGPNFTTHSFNSFAFFLTQPEDVEAVLTSGKHIEKSFLYSVLHDWLGTGLLTGSGELWHSRRKLLTPAFHFRILEKFSDQLQYQAQGLVDQLREASAALPAGQPLDVQPLVSRNALYAICETAMGTADFENTAAGGEKGYLDAIHSLTSLVVARMIRPWLWYTPVYRLTQRGRTEQKNLKIVHGFTERVIAERKAELEQAGWDEGTGQDAGPACDQSRRCRPFLDVLLRAQHEGAALSDLDIRHEVDTFMFAGHDTTSIGTVWALQLLGQHPSVQERLAEEVLGAGLTWDIVSKLSYLDMVVKECLRVRPSIPMVWRTINEDLTLRSGKIIPGGCNVSIIIYALHRNEKIFPDPEKFDPERFTPEMERTRHPFAYLPFSAGPRNCIGKKYALMEMKLFVSAVIANFVIRSATSYSETGLSPDIALRPINGVKLILTPR